MLTRTKEERKYVNKKTYNHLVTTIVVLVSRLQCNHTHWNQKWARDCCDFLRMNSAMLGAELTNWEREQNKQSKARVIKLQHLVGANATRLFQ